MTEDNNSQINYYCYDVIVIGGGSAGLRAAIEAHDRGSAVLLISKSKQGDPHTVLARGGINAAIGSMDPKDNWMIHASDTLIEGEHIADYERVEILCKSAPEAINELVNWGARFHREEDGRLTQRFFGAHTYRRTVFYEDWTGDEMIRVLMRQVMERKIPIIDDIYVTKLLVEYDHAKHVEKSIPIRCKIKGAVGIDIRRKQLVKFDCKSLILATGGYTRVYSVSSSRNYEHYGEGIELAYEAGVDLVDMEMVQFHPTGMVWPQNALGTLATEAIRGEGGILLNSRNERFMKKYYPERMELGPRDVVARAIFNEIAEGRGTPHKGVWLDVTDLSLNKILDRLPTMYKQFKDIAGVDISREKMEVGPTAHYSMGGLSVDFNCKTKVEGLFAAGELISQIHGANRLGGNSLLDTIVFGKIAGREASIFEKQTHGSVCDTPSELKKQEKAQNFQMDDFMVINEPEGFRKEIQNTMDQYVGIVRNAKNLQKGLAKILVLKDKFKSQLRILNQIELHDDYNIKNLIATLEVKSSLIVCEAIIKSALMREESRGAHFRTDFPSINNDTWRVNIYCTKDNSDGTKMTLYKKNVKEVKGPIEEVISSQVKAVHNNESE
ncbi:FAD-binding protein [Candidatus Nitrosocosmicus hydrocola]|uniref:FAD-binding protein n=1 Tax=Candidatus Nitrosocosmicus hydrocola TaxID=1826872 RepID=UPI000AEC41C3|nr:FAD-binding protein [Candidatus Nitrosocosmicus hydrocola]